MTQEDLKELINYNGGKTFATAIFKIELNDSIMKGWAWIDGYEALRVESSENIGNSDPVRMAKNLKYWLDADLCNLLLEFEEGVNK